MCFAYDDCALVQQAGDNSGVDLGVLPLQVLAAVKQGQSRDTHIVLDAHSLSVEFASGSARDFAFYLPSVEFVLFCRGSALPFTSMHDFGFVVVQLVYDVKSGQIGIELTCHLLDFMIGRIHTKLFAQVFYFLFGWSSNTFLL